MGRKLLASDGSFPGFSTATTLACRQSLRPAQTRGSDLASALTMLWAKDVAFVCSVTSGSISPH